MKAYGPFLPVPDLDLLLLRQGKAEPANPKRWPSMT